MIRKLVGWSVGCGLILASIGCSGVERSLGDSAGGAAGTATESSSSPRQRPTAGGSAGEGDGQAGATATAEPGVGPIDATDLPHGLDLVCDGPYPTLAIVLPCRIGMNLGGVNATECRLTRAPDKTVISFLLPLATLPALLNQPVELPFVNDSVPSPGAELDGERFVGELSGVATFSQVSLADRAFVAKLAPGHIAWTGDHGTSFACDVADGPFWAVAGDFL